MPAGPDLLCTPLILAPHLKAPPLLPSAYPRLNFTNTGLDGFHLVSYQQFSFWHLGLVGRVAPSRADGHLFKILKESNRRATERRALPIRPLTDGSQNENCWYPIGAICLISVRRKVCRNFDWIVAYLAFAPTAPRLIGITFETLHPLPPKVYQHVVNFRGSRHPNMLSAARSASRSQRSLGTSAHFVHNCGKGCNVS